MYSLIVKQFIRSKAVITTLILILVIGTVSIFIGRQFLLKEEQHIASVTQQQQEHISKNVQYNNSNMGLLLYYLRFAFIAKPDKLAALSIGQRDINPGIQRITIRNLEAQKYDTDLNNPANLLSGHLDLGFVIIYLFPLLIIAFSFNLLSEEEEHGTWRMVAVQSKSPVRFLIQKISVRAFVIYGVLFLLLVCSILILSIPLNQALLAFIALSVAYLLFWFALSFLIISLRKSSSFNALSLLSIWVVLAILLPAAVNNYVAGKYPVPEALSTLIKQRDGYHQKWDVEKKVTMEKFYEHYPQFRQYTVSEDEFSYTWYYAMQQMGDDESQADSKAMREKIIQREVLSRKFSMLIPTMHVQLSFNDLAGTSLAHHLQFLDQTTAYHEQLRLHFYPAIFTNAPVENENWNDFKPTYAVQETRISWGRLVLPIVLLSMLFIIIALSRFKNTVLN
ncbi:MAG: DUF3526 domain-containing protein [Cytophagia bacterium]|nr:DUF3526 domain-containing protein [Cytophagia bacterium]